MSRIDEALRRAEAMLAERDGAQDVPVPETATPPRFTLDEYPREAPVPLSERYVPPPPQPEPLATMMDRHPVQEMSLPPSSYDIPAPEPLVRLEAPAPVPHARVDAPPPVVTPDVSPADTSPVRPLAMPVSPDGPFRDAPRPSGRRGSWGEKLVAGRGPGLVSVEQYRRLAAALHDVQVERGVKTVMVTSTVPGEGKTLTVANLGITLSESYARRVLVIDADLRWPSLHEVFGTKNSIGLGDVLSGAVTDLPLEEVSPYLSVLPSGKPGQNPLAGLTSDRMMALLEECAGRFDWILLDTPPVGLLPDAQLLARLTRAVVFVIAAGSTPAALVERAVAEVGPDSIIGTVLNRVDERTVPEVNYYNQYAGIQRAAAPLEL